MKELSKDPYKGTRDFYPKQMRIQRYLFDTMRQVVERYGYEEYTASILEESDIYRAKTGEEIVNEQTYSFTDRGGRDVTLRPEMTPTVARMVARKRKELPMPIRWYSIPNCFRYERPQRGRLREFWQLNVDILEVDSIYSDIEVMQMLYDIMIAFGADPSTFVIRVNNRKLMNMLFSDVLGLDTDSAYRLSKLIDKKAKISSEMFDSEAKVLVGDQLGLLNQFLSARSIDQLPTQVVGSQSVKDIITVLNCLQQGGVINCIFDPTLMRGFDYYTGVVFEVFDTNPINSRSLFGGGRYDDLVNLFGVDPVSATGFGMGDVTLEDYLETYGLIPNLESGARLTLCTTDASAVEQSLELAALLRSSGVSTAVDYTDKKIGQKVKQAEQSGSEYVICIGSDELSSNIFKLKKLADYSEESIDRQGLLVRFS